MNRKRGDVVFERARLHSAVYSMPFKKYASSFTAYSTVLHVEFCEDHSPSQKRRIFGAVKRLARKALASWNPDKDTYPMFTFRVGGGTITFEMSKTMFLRGNTRFNLDGSPRKL